MINRDEILACFSKHEDYMNDRIKNGIENNRKGWAFINILTHGPNPEIPDIIPAMGDITVKVKQKSHEFKYGANLFMLDELENQDKNLEYRKLFSDAFNIATLPIYWCGLEPIDGKPRFDKNSPKVYRRPALDRCVEFCEKNGIEPKAHCLVYDYFSPDYTIGYTLSEIKKRYERRFAELAERYAHRIPGWEVTNEFESFEHMAKTVLYKSPDVIEWAFGLAEAYFPDNKLIINDAIGMWGADGDFHRDRSNYYQNIDRALARGARIDSVGFQYHMFVSEQNYPKMAEWRYDPYNIYENLDTYAKLGKPLQITEITIPCFSDKPEDEALQAEIVDKLYRMWFSHDAVDTIIYWNMPDGYAAYAQPGDMANGENKFYGGLLRFDMSPKPAYHVIKDMFEKEFRTETVCHGKDGRAEFKGFYGDYDLEITVNGKTYNKTVNFSKYGSNEIRVYLD